MKKMTIHYFNSLKSGKDVFFPQQNISLSNLKSLNLKETLKNVMAPFYGWGSIASRLESLRRGSLLFKFSEMFTFTTILKGEMKIFT